MRKSIFAATLTAMTISGLASASDALQDEQVFYLECRHTSAQDMPFINPLSCQQVPAGQIVRLDRLDEAAAREAASRRMEEEKKLAALEARRVERETQRDTELEETRRKLQEMDGLLRLLSEKYTSLGSSQQATPFAAVPAEPPKQEVKPEPRIEARKVEPTPAYMPVPSPATVLPETYGPIAQGESINRIVNRLFQGSNINRKDIAAAFVRLNPDAFNNGDMSTIIAGRMLRVPRPEEIRKGEGDVTIRHIPKPKAPPEPPSGPPQEPKPVTRTLPNALAPPAQVPAPVSPQEARSILQEPKREAPPVATKAPTKEADDAKAQLLREVQAIQRELESAKQQLDSTH